MTFESMCMNAYDAAVKAAYPFVPSPAQFDEACGPAVRVLLTMPTHLARRYILGGSVRPGTTQARVLRLYREAHYARLHLTKEQASSFAWAIPHVLEHRGRLTVTLPNGVDMLVLSTGTVLVIGPGKPDEVYSTIADMRDTYCL